MTTKNRVEKKTSIPIQNSQLAKTVPGWAVGTLAFNCGMQLGTEVERLCGVFNSIGAVLDPKHPARRELDAVESIMRDLGAHADSLRLSLVNNSIPFADCDAELEVK
jgi:hypothetical protein